MSSKHTDQELLALCRDEGDAAAFADLVSRYKQPMFNFILRMVSDPPLAEELFQETFLRIYEKMHTFQGGASFSPWAYRIAHNLCIDELRRPRMRLFVPLESNQEEGRPAEERLPGNEPDPEVAYSRTQIGERIRKAVELLPEKLRAVFILHQYQGLSYDQVATTLEIPIGTVKSRMHSALNSLARELKDLPGYESSRRKSR